MARHVMWFAALLALFTPAVADAQRCEDAERWAETCSARGPVAVSVERCLPGGVIVGTEVAGEAILSVEIARERPNAFRQVGELGVSPIAEYADWSLAPESVRTAFGAVIDCIDADPSLDVPEGRLVAGGREGQGPVTPPPPWLLLGALLLALLAAGLGIRAGPRSGRAIIIGAVPPLLAATMAYFLRAAIADPSFVHQNGQGPLWVNHALCTTPAYGPGYFEVFGWAVRALGGEPSAAVFQIQAILAALGVGSVWLIARALSVRPVLAVALTVVVAVEPALFRLAQSESYFAAIASLLLIAGALVAVGARRRRPTDPIFLIGVVAAGLLVAQAARIHPVAWVPSALLPLVVAVGPGRLRTRLQCAGVATVGVGLTAAAFAVSVIGSVTGGAVGEQWLPGLLSRVPTGRIEWGLSVGGASMALAVAFARKRPRGVVRGAALFVVVALAFCTHLIGAVTPIIVTAYLLLFLPAFVAALGASIEGAIRRRTEGLLAAAIVVLATLVFAGTRAAGLLTLPTDTREQAWVLEQREELPGGTTVAFVSVAGPRRRLHLPLYGQCRAGAVSAIQLDAEGAARDLALLPGSVVWYRSSLCATDDGHDYCDAVEARYRLTPISTTDLPARASMEGLDYEEGTVSVGLFTLDAQR